MNYVLVDECNNAGKQLAIVQGDTKTIQVYLQTKDNAPVQFPYNAIDIEFHVQGISGAIIKNFASGVSWLGAYFGVAISFSSADTANMQLNRVSMSCVVTTPTGKTHYDFPNCFLLSPPIVP